MELRLVSCLKKWLIQYGEYQVNLLINKSFVMVQIIHKNCLDDAKHHRHFKLFFCSTRSRNGVVKDIYRNIWCFFGQNL